MTLNLFLEAIASRLTGIWPDRKVDIGKIPKGADDGFFVRIVDSDQEKRLGRRRKRNIQFEVLYFLRSDDTTEFNDWAETMYDNFEALEVREDDSKTRSVRLTNVSARKDDERRFQFLFDADFYFVVTPEEAPDMGNLEHKETQK